MASKAAVAVVCVLAIVGIAFGAVALVHADDAKKTADDKGEISYTFYIGLGDVTESEAAAAQSLIIDKIKADDRFGYTTYLASGSTHTAPHTYVDDKFTVIVKIAMVSDEKGVMELADSIQDATGKIILVEKSYADYQLLGI